MHLLNNTHTIEWQHNLRYHILTGIIGLYQYSETIPKMHKCMITSNPQRTNKWPINDQMTNKFTIYSLAQLLQMKEPTL